jgi:hypothetical protein
MPKCKNETGNFKHSTPDQFYLLDIPSGVCVALQRTLAAIIPQLPVNQTKTTTSSAVQTSIHRPQPLELPRKLEELTPPPFTNPLTNRQTIAIYGKEWEVSVLFRYFRVRWTLSQLEAVGSRSPIKMIPFVKLLLVLLWYIWQHCQ